MKRMLVIGGTRFFGKRLVEKLVQQGGDVTVLTRGRTQDPFGNSVRRLRADRTDFESMRQALGTLEFDIVYDKMCFTPQEAKDAIALMKGRTGKYIVTSSMSVYPFREARLDERVFDPYHYIIPAAYSEGDYAEGKRLMEAVFVQKADFPVAAVRFPIVLGHDDYTRRLHWHVEHILQSLPLGIPNPDARLSFIRSDEAADFLAWLGESDLEGPVNACSRGNISLKRLISTIEAATGKEARIVAEAEPKHQSPFGAPLSWVMDTSKAEGAGFQFQVLDQWLPQLIREIAAAGGR